MPDFTDYSMKGRTYRFFKGKPLYPFGFGLTYSKTQVLEASYSACKEGLKVSVKAKNSGKVFTEDVIQIYAQNKGSKNAPENPRLVAFKRIALDAGKTGSFELEITSDSLKVVNDKGEYVDEGKVVLYVGTCQPDQYSRSLSGTGTIELEVK